MVRLLIEQGLNTIELEFDETTEASAMVEHLIPYSSMKTKFTIVCEIEEVKGEKTCS